MKSVRQKEGRRKRTEQKIEERDEQEKMLCFTWLCPFADGLEQTFTCRSNHGQIALRCLPVCKPNLDWLLTWSESPCRTILIFYKGYNKKNIKIVKLPCVKQIIVKAAIYTWKRKTYSADLKEVGVGNLEEGIYGLHIADSVVVQQKTNATF